ncbi:MAG: D-Ala-D-Ala carboxypeptidase family metallohydrolase [Eubacterium aggregans]|uniref:D-Ala-D-Ala carboxypeptidase family metallohydrolase n=1 Tax=Eubacterium aggregans TaxID=81409 RepID=UPI002B1F077D|nr:D-Ala-D-Ala carboxypeptidase family metallohydrolase [Eubacterium aggregans]MEA5073111.1 D-Ala-D-Ala carboxypeptidase family metallohydrolase [Eubacterium aggregans]
MSELVLLGQKHSNNFIDRKTLEDGIPGEDTKMQGIACVQHAMNLDYGVGIPVDGYWGALSDNAFGSHYVCEGETQHMVTALEILFLLNDVNPGGVECPGVFGQGLSNAVEAWEGCHGLTVDRIAGRQVFYTLMGMDPNVDYGEGVSSGGGSCEGYDANNLPNFGPDEFKCACGCGGDIKDELKCKIQAVRAELSAYLGRDAQIVVTSGFRCPPENARQGGVPDSLHQYGEACDVYTPGMSDAMVDTIVQVAHNHDLKCGTYYAQQFVHLQLGGSDFSGD